jgi:NSS family neurotransmitter:Na+ symporter
MQSSGGDAADRRGTWGSSIGFVLAAAGSAIGLGNIWGFPYMAAQNGGGAFVILYLTCVVLIAVPVLYAELSIGRAAQKSPVGAFDRLAPRSWWPGVGALGVLTGFGILAFYSLVAGWTVGYFVKAIRGEFADGLTMADSQATFDAFRAGALETSLWTAAFFLLAILVVRGGIRGGIEFASKILMPIFFVLLVLLVARSVTLPGSAAGVSFLFNPDFSRLTPKVVLSALAQALFSMSLGMGAMITYGSYLSKKENLPKAGGTVAFFDTLIAILAGLMIFPALFAAGAEPAGEEGLVFVVLPTIFDQLPLGHLFSIAFYGLLCIAALTSAISLLEVIVSYFVDERDWSREKSVWLLGTLCFVLAVPCAISSKFMGVLVQIFWIYSLSIGALLICVFVGWKWGVKAAVNELASGRPASSVLHFWAVLIKFFCPVVAAIILISRIWPLIAKLWGG